MRETIEDAQKSLVNKIKEAIDRGDHAAAAAYTHALGRLHDFSPLSLQHNSGGFPKQVGEMGMKWLPLIISVVVCGTTYFKTVADIRSANSAIQRNKDETNAQQQELAQKQAEIINNQMNQSREWNLKAIQFLDSKFPVLLGPESKQRTALINLIRNVYPPELSTPILNYAVSIQRSSGKPDSAKELVAVAGQIALGDRNTTVNIIVPEGTDSEIGLCCMNRIA
jgi:hypothetical protein